MSKARATARWAKYIALYDDWLDYVVQKVARRSGTVIELTPASGAGRSSFSGPRRCGTSSPVRNSVTRPRAMNGSNLS